MTWKGAEVNHRYMQYSETQDFPSPYLLPPEHLSNKQCELLTWFAVLHFSLLEFCFVFLALKDTEERKEL